MLIALSNSGNAEYKSGMSRSDLLLIIEKVAADKLVPDWGRGASRCLSR